MKIVKESDTSVSEICEVLKNDGLVIFPCETVYGAAVDASSELAVRKLSSYKKRPLGKPYSIMVADQEMAEQYVNLNKTAKDLYKKFLPGPVTVISKIKLQKAKIDIKNKKDVLAKGVASELGTVGVRIPDYPFLIKLIKAYGKPLTATSANASYQRRPYKIADILENISERQKSLIDVIIDAGELPHNEPSTVIDTTLDDITMLRQGGVVVSDQLSVISRSEENTQNIGKELWQKYEKYAGSRAIIFALEGEMGAGKTQLTKGIARAMGITDRIVSPTFNLQHNFKFTILNLNSNFKFQISNFQTFSHMDAWRMMNGEELENLGLKGLINDKSVMAIEWADRVADTIRKYNEEAVIVWVKIKYGPPSLKLRKGEQIENIREISWGSL